jgi:hypothetical protein
MPSQNSVAVPPDRSHHGYVTRQLGRGHVVADPDPNPVVTDPVVNDSVAAAILAAAPAVAFDSVDPRNPYFLKFDGWYLQIHTFWNS